MIPHVQAPQAIPEVKKLLLDYLQNRSSSGTAFKEGEMIRFGWFYFRILEGEAGLTLFGPDLKNFPLQWQPDISMSLNLALVQKYVTESYGLGIEECDLNMTAVVSKSIEERTDFFLNRLGPAKDKNSGWYIGFVDDPLDMNDAKSFKMMSLYELSLQIPDAIKFWFLPGNCQVLLTGNNLQVLQDFNVIPPKPGTYMHKLIHGNH